MTVQKTSGDDTLLTPRELSKLHWRCRRGLLENDLFIEQFFNKYESALTTSHARALNLLMDLADNDLLDLFLRRKEPTEYLDNADVHQLLRMIRKPSI